MQALFSSTLSVRNSLWPYSSCKLRRGLMENNAA